MLLIDFGSTYTKGVVIDVETSRILGRAQVPTSEINDPSQMINNLLDELRFGQGISNKYLARKYASSSAAGGLRIVAIGLVPELTLKAAQQAILGAGGRVVGSYAHKLNRKQIQEIATEKPNIILLAGGTDGGEEDTILHNSEVLAESSVDSIFLVAGNSSVAEEVSKNLENGGKSATVSENVMKDIGVLNIDPARSVIRNIFINHIAYGKNDRVYRDIVDGVLMPTPSAVLSATIVIHDLLRADSSGVMTVDIGGATTDIHSVYQENIERTSNIVLKGLPEPIVKRTVEGDLGVRHSLKSLISTLGDLGTFLRYADLPIERVGNFHLISDRWSREVDSLPTTQEEGIFDLALARMAARVAMERHVGRVERAYTPMGEVTYQLGKDFSRVSHLIGTGGPICNSSDPKNILEACSYRDGDPLVLKPRSPKFLFDKHYSLYAVGLLSEIDISVAKKVAEATIDVAR